MFRLSTRTVVVLAFICFLGSVIMQAWGIRSAYEGELSLYNKEKRQFQAELEQGIKQNTQLKEQFKTLLHKYRENGSLQKPEQQLLLKKTGTIIQQLLQEKQYGVHLNNYGIAGHKHDTTQQHRFTPVAFAHNKGLSADAMEKAGRVCLYCLLQTGDGKHDDFNYELMLLYGKEKTGIYKKMAVLIFGSFLFLLFLGLLFRLLLKKYGQEKRLSEAKNDFINNLSHEIQTPVFAVQVANKLIKEKSVQQADLQPLIAVIEKETQQLKQHAGKILELASLENEQVQLNPETTELNSFIEEKRATLDIMMQSKGGRLITNYSKKQLVCELDRTHLNNVLVSLTENAIKYNDGTPEVMIETREKEDLIFMHVKDNGIGIDPQYLPYVFDKFYRAPNTSKNGTKGFGLGLSYVSQIIKLHHGSVDIKSESWRGTVVTILLPKAKSNV